MKTMVPYIWAAGVVHMLIASANFFAPKKLQYRENLSKVSTIVRQIFVVHSIYIVLVLLLFSGLCFFFAPDLAGASRLGKFLSGFMAVFWLLRTCFQVFYYDPQLKRQNRFFDVGFTSSFLYLGLVFVLAAVGVGGTEPQRQLPTLIEPSSIHRLFSNTLWLAGIGHFCVLIASFQVPSRMHWKEDLAKLMPANRKLMYTYGVFIVMTIIAFGVLTLLLHDELLRGEKSALGLATFIGVFWLMRVVIDFTYHNHADWPQGTRFVIAHVLLTTLFLALTSTYLGLVAWHVWRL